MEELAEHGGSWQRAIARLASGQSVVGRFVRLGPTPMVLRAIGLGPRDLVMSPGKIILAMKDHPHVPIKVWAQLPERLKEPLAGFPSAKRDGSIVVVIVDRDDLDDPIVAPILWDTHQKLNIVLSVYGRSPDSGLSGDDWIKLQIQRAAEDQLQFFGEIGSADAKPKPEPAEATSWSSGSIPVDQPTEPRREILTISSKVKAKPADKA